MKSWQRLIALLLVINGMLYAMDSDNFNKTSTLDELDEEVHLTNLFNVLNRCVTIDNITYMKTFRDCFNGAEINFTRPLCQLLAPYISAAYFQELMNLLSECQAILGDRFLVSESKVLLNDADYVAYMRQKNLDIDVLQKLISKKCYSIEEIISFLNMIDYLDMQYLQESLLRTLLIALLSLSTKQKHQRNVYLHNLNPVYYEELKQMLMKWYFIPLFPKAIEDEEIYKAIMKKLESCRESSLIKTFNQLTENDTSCCVIL